MVLNAKSMLLLNKKITNDISQSKMSTFIMYMLEYNLVV